MKLKKGLQSAHVILFTHETLSQFEKKKILFCTEKVHSF